MSLLPDPIDTAKVPPLCEPSVPGFQVHHYRLTEGRQAGCQLIVIHSPGVCAAICPTRGMSLWRAKLAGVDCHWNSPVRGPVHPSWVPLSEPSGLGWLDGFDELLVRCGLRSFGAPDFAEDGRLLYPLHGCIGNLPAENVQVQLSDDGQELTVSGEVFESRFLLHHLRLKVQYRFRLHQPEIQVHDQVSNLGGAAHPIQLLYHINFGKPLLDDGSRFYAATNEVVARDRRADEDLSTWDQYLGPTEGYSEQVYFMQPLVDDAGWSTTVLSNPRAGVGCAVRYRAETLPYFTLWKNTAAESTGYVTGLEPGTGFPNPRTFEEAKGRLAWMQPGDSRDFQLSIRASQEPQQISQWIGELDRLQGGQPTKLSASRAEWCVPR